MPFYEFYYYRAMLKFCFFIKFFYSFISEAFTAADSMTNNAYKSSQVILLIIKEINAYIQKKQVIFMA